MKQSQLIFKTKKENILDESINANLLIKASFVKKLMSGVYSYLPLGNMVLRNIESIIREEMNKLGSQEILMPALHPKEPWEKTKRWELKEMFKIRDKEYGLGWTHEEIVVPLAKEAAFSKKDFPFSLYQIQTKFRNELRAKSGVLRGIEFLMKDLYSFHVLEKDLDVFYEKVKKSYFNIFKKCGLEKKTFLTLASGGTFSKYSHEFQTITEAGEDQIYLCEKCSLAINKEIIKQEKYQCPKCKNKKLTVKKAIEVGNIFKLYDKYTKPFNFKISDKYVFMGCYGLGISRLMGAIVEICHDEKGIIWPEQISPFNIHLISIGKVKKQADKLYQVLQKKGNKVLYDDRDKNTGEKLVEADLIGLPIRIIISEKTLQKNCIEIKKRDEKTIKLQKYNR
ncbi:MAG: His/Gly/Thr/Pro-type tRNA ligase C-terminal domain-containing protein [Candidatus Pacebacteria bacterium]|nr:His/Gly/Thr/Pro-type tRNA ligase C-terminal domain-containing protein [Candidatus Paceibacterota bacterium]